MPEDTTGQGDVTTAGQVDGQEVATQDVKPAPGETEQPQAGEELVAALQAQLDEQRKIQAGLDKRVAQLSAQLGVEEAAKAKLAAELEEARTSTGASAEELDSLRQTVEALKGEQGVWEQRLAATQAQAERLQVVASEFPALAPLVEANALPQAADMEEFRQKLGAMATAFNAQAAASYQQMVDGVKPPASPSASTAPDDLNTLHRSMLAALKEGNMEEYNTLRERWYAASAAQ